MTAAFFLLNRLYRRQLNPLKRTGFKRRHRDHPMYCRILQVKLLFQIQHHFFIKVKNFAIVFFFNKANAS